MKDDEQQPVEERGITRRQALGLGAAAAGAVAAGSLINSQAATATPFNPAPLANSTLGVTLLHGPPVNAQGYRRIIIGGGEPSLARFDLIADAVPSPGTRTPLLAFTQFTDMHLVDAQSPARVEFLDRLDDPDLGVPGLTVLPFQSSYRPWEMLSLQISEAMAQRVRQFTGGAPVTGRPIDFTITTGDNADNTQYNEVRWHIDLMDGGKTIRPDSGNLNKWEGVGGPDDHDIAYWHPNGTPLFSKPDNYLAKRGYPTAPGLLNLARHTFTSTGVGTDWYSVFGNHDGLVQGTVPSLGVLSAIATGNLKVTGLPLGIDLVPLLTALAGGSSAALVTLLTLGPAKIVTADKNRRMLNKKQLVTEHFTTSGTPVGHGYTAANVATNTAYYSFDRNGVHCISLDTCNPFGYSDGSIDGPQMTWLTAQLQANSSRYLDTNGNWVNGTGTDKLIFIFSHHTIATMENQLGVDRVNGNKVRDLLLRFPNVVAWVNGHTHHNEVLPHARAATAAAGGGFWEINTAAHIDWPSQARIVEVVDNGDATLSIFGTIIDDIAPNTWSAATLGTVLGQAALARELAVNDPQRDAETASRDGKRGTPTDRNVELVVKKPF
jgi:metallophosphoesterase (TIGR03767 family)